MDVNSLCLEGFEPTLSLKKKAATSQLAPAPNNRESSRRPVEHTSSVLPSDHQFFPWDLGSPYFIAVAPH